MKKKILCLLVTMIMVAAVIPASVLTSYAEGNECSTCGGIGKIFDTECEWCEGDGECRFCLWGMCTECEGDRLCYLCHGKEPYCRECDWTGYCRECGGTGSCLRCDGTGLCWCAADCPTCGGTGMVEEMEGLVQADGMKVNAANDGRVLLTWNKVSDASEYAVYVQKEGQKFKKVAVTGDTSYIVKNVKAKKLDGNKGYRFYVAVCS